MIRFRRIGRLFANHGFVELVRLAFSSYFLGGNHAEISKVRTSGVARSGHRSVNSGIATQQASSEAVETEQQQYR